MTDRPHVVGVVGNDIIFDTRIKKVAAAAAAAGYKSTILCYTQTGVQRVTRMGEVDVIRVPIQFRAQNKNGRVPRPLRPINGAELAERHAGPRTHLLARRRWLEGALVDPTNTAINRALTRLNLTWVRVSLKVRHETFRIRRRGHVELDKVVRLFNRTRVRTTLRALRPWRDAIPNIADYEVAFGPILEELRPDLIHAHDYHMIGIAVTASRNLKSQGHTTRVVYDAHELVEGLSYSKDIIKGWLDLEGTYISDADAVTGVSPEQIDRIQRRYALTERPTLVMNAPVVHGLSPSSSDIRRDSGVTGRILAYHGSILLERGLGTLVRAMPLVDPDVHVVILAPKANPLLPDIDQAADALGVSDRVHFLDYVPAEQLPVYLSTADVAVVPYLFTGNNDIALPNKLFEAIQAGLPLLVSNMRSMSRVVTENGIGEVFEADSPEDLAAKLTRILAELEKYRASITPDLKREMSWDTQANRLVAVYQALLGSAGPDSVEITVSDITEEFGNEDRYRPSRLAIGPRNMAGQAYEIAEAVQSRLGIPAVSFSVEKPRYRFPIHIQIGEDQWRDPSWQLGQRRLLASGFTHVIAESGTGILGTMNGGFIDEQIDALREDGIKVAVLLHGSEIRDPDRHRQLPFSPYAFDDDLTRSIVQANARLREHLRHLTAPIFVTTPDLLEDVDATWLPVVVNVDRWGHLEAPFQGRTPTVLHLPTNSRLKGTEYVDPVLTALQAQGRIRYLRPKDGAAAGEVSALMSQADIVVDQIVIGAYGLMSCQAMAAGRLSIANTRNIGFLRSECPVIDADPGTLREVLDALLDDAASWRDRADWGRKFVSTYHDGAATAEALKPFFDLT